MRLAEENAAAELALPEKVALLNEVPPEKVASINKTSREKITPSNWAFGEKVALANQASAGKTKPEKFTASLLMTIDVTESSSPSSCSFTSCIVFLVASAPLTRK